MKALPIRIYEYNTTSFDNNGICTLFPSKAVITRKLFDKIYSLDITQPITDDNKWKHIKEDRIIIANDQPFRIRYVNKTQREVIAYCEHLFYDLENNFIEDVEIIDRNGNQALDKILSSTVYKHNFSGTSDLETINSDRIIHKNVLSALLSSDEDSFINCWSNGIGELDIDGFSFKINKKIGKAKGYKITYGKNLTGINVNIDMTNVVTKIIPVGYDGITIPDKFVDSDYINNYAMPIIKKIEYNDVKWKGQLEDKEPSDDEFIYETLEEAQAELYRRAELEFSENKIDLPSITYEVNFIELSNTMEYQSFQFVTKIDIGDDVIIEHDKLGINIPARCVEYEYNCLTCNFDKVTLGHYNKNIFYDVKKTIQNTDEIVKELPNKLNTFLQEAREYTTNYINGGWGGYIYYTPNGLYILDNPDINLATEVAVLNKNGLGFSNTGINGTFETAITRDGHINASFMDTGILNAQIVKSGILESVNKASWINMETGEFNLANKIKYENNEFKITVSDDKTLDDKLKEQDNILSNINNTIESITTAPMVEISGEQLFIYKNNFSDTPEPSQITLTVTKKNVTDGVWQYLDTDGVWADYTQNGILQTGETLTVYHNSKNFNTANSKSMKIRFYVNDNVYDETTLVKLTSGASGIDGKASYLHIKYSNDGGLTFTDNNGETIGTYIGTYTDFVETDSTDVSKYTWAKFIGENGKDGTSISIQGSYTSSDWSSIYESLIPTSQKGDSYLVDGELYVFDGVAFINAGNIKGDKGDDGRSSYIHIKYSNDGGITFTNNDGETVGDYMGTYVDYIESDSTDVNRYTWKKIVGEKGVNGNDSYAVILTNETHSFLSDYNGNITSDSIAKTKIYVYKGTNSINFSIGDITVPNGISITNNLSSGGRTVTITALAGSSLADSGTIEIPIIADGKTFAKTFSYNKVKKGIDGSDAKLVYVTGEQVFKYENNFTGKPTPETIPLTVTRTNTTATGKWQYMDENSNWQDFTQNGTLQTEDTLNVSYQSKIFGTTSAKSMRVRYYISDVISDEITLIKVSDGANGTDGVDGNNGNDAYTIILSNENHTFPATYTGNIESPITITIEVLSYKGTNAVTPTIGTLPKVSGLTITKDGTIITVVANSGTSLADNGTFNIPITIDGIPFTKTFTWAKSKAGLSGSNGEDGYTILLSNENISFRANGRGEITTQQTTSCNILAYKGSTSMPITIESLPTVEGLTLTKSSNIITIKANTGNSLSSNGSFDINITCDGHSFIKTITWIKVNDGIKGEDAKYVTVSGEQVFKYANNFKGIPTPETIKLTVKKFNINGGKWQYKDENGVWQDFIQDEISQTKDTINVGYNSKIFGTTESKTMTVRFYIDDNINDEITLVKISDSLPIGVGVFGNQIFKYKKNFSGVPTPSSITLTAIKKNTTATGKWQYLELDGTWTDYTKNNVVQTGLTLGVSYNSKFFGTSDERVMRLRYYIDDSLYDEMTIAKVSDGDDGKDSYTVLLTNEMHVLYTSSNGNISADIPHKAYVLAYKGTTKVSFTYGTITVPEGVEITTENDKINIIFKKGTALADNGTIDVPIIIDGITFNKTLSWVKAKDGNDSYTIILTNESHSFISDNNGNIPTASETTTKVIAYKGINEVVPTIGTLPTVSGLTLSESNQTITIKANTGSDLSDHGKFDIPITIDGLSFTKSFSWSKSKVGEKGTDARYVKLISSSQMFKSKDGGVSFSPDNINLMSIYHGVTHSSWKCSRDGGVTWENISNYTGITEPSNGKLTISKSSNVFSDTVTCVTFKDISNDVNVYDTITIVKLYDVGELELGGVNLLPDSKKMINGWVNNNTFVVEETSNGFNKVTKEKTGETTIYDRSYQSPMIPLTKLGKMSQGIVISCEVNVDSAANWDDTGVFLYELYNYNKKRVGYQRITSESCIKKPAFVAQSWSRFIYKRPDIYKTKITKTSNYTSDSDFYYISIKLLLGKNGKISYRKPKLEIGNVATDWSPCPDDVDTSITAAINPLIETNESLTKRFDNMISDNVLSSFEKKQIKKDLNEIDAQFNDMQRTIELYNDAILSGAFSEYQYAYDNLHTVLDIYLEDLNVDTELDTTIINDVFYQYGVEYSNIRSVLDIYIKDNLDVTTATIQTLSDSVDIAITKSSSNEENLNTIGKHMSFSDDGWLELYATNNGEEGRFKTRITNEKLSFVDNDNEVAYMSNQKLYINNAEIDDELAVGNVIIRKSAKGGIMFSWLEDETSTTSE